MSRCRLCAWWHLCQQQAGVDDGVLQISIFGRVTGIDTACNDSDGAAGNRAVMRRGIDPTCKTGHHNIPCFGKLFGQFLGQSDRIDRGIAGTHNGN